MMPIEKFISVDEAHTITKAMPPNCDESEVTRMLSWVVQTRTGNAIIKLILDGKVKCSYPNEKAEPTIYLIKETKNTEDTLSELILSAL
jgi:hypothetical protein